MNINVDETFVGYVVISNSDLTEGKGFSTYPFVSRSQAAAARKAVKAGVMGSAAPVAEVQLFRLGGMIYGPVNLIEPTNADLKSEDDRKAWRIAKEKADKAGLTAADIAALSKGAP